MTSETSCVEDDERVLLDKQSHCCYVLNQFALKVFAENLGKCT